MSACKPGFPSPWTFASTAATAWPGRWTRPGSPTASASEYATDLLFRDAPSLAALYPRLVQHGLRPFASPAVMRFLGRTTPTQSGRVDPRFTGEVISDLKPRPEGIRVKHSVNGNSVKM